MYIDFVRVMEVYEKEGDGWGVLRREFLKVVGLCIFF